MIEVMLRCGPIRSLHLGHEGAAHQEHAGEVRVLHSAPFLERENGDVPAQIHARVIDEDLDRPHLGADRGFEFEDLLFLRDVEQEEAPAWPPASGYLLRDGCEFFPIARHQNEMRAALRQREGHGAARGLCSRP